MLSQSVASPTDFQHGIEADKLVFAVVILNELIVAEILGDIQWAHKNEDKGLLRKSLPGCDI